MPSALAWFASANQTGQIVGPALGGVLYVLGPTTVYGITIALWCLGGAMLSMMRVEKASRSTEPLSLRSLFGGFRFVRHDRVILGTQHVGRVLFSVLTIYGVSVTVFALSTVMWLSLGALATMGAADVVSVVIRFSLVQLRTPPEMRGRVSAVNGLFTGTSNQLGDFRAGVMGALFGAVPAVVIGGVGTILVTAIWMFLFPELRRIRSLDDVPAGTQPSAKA